MRKPLYLLAIACAFLRTGGPCAAAERQVWVSPRGSDLNSGSSNSPAATLAEALDKWRLLSSSNAVGPSDVFTVVLHGGIYPLAQTLQLAPPGGASTNLPLIIESAPNEHATLSGGVAIGGWKKLAPGDAPGLPSAAQGRIWAADVPRLGGRVLEFRELWVNGRKAIRAREPNAPQLARLVAWDKTNRTATIPAAMLAGVANPAALEMVVDQVWEIAVLRVESIHLAGANAVLTFKEPESRLEFEHPWPPVTVNAKYQAPFFLANAVQFLDSPGEWFEDVSAGRLYYWPRPGEDLATVSAYVPALETLVNISGASHVRFAGITFSHTTWLRPSLKGHVPLQAGMYLLDAKKLSPKGTPYHPKLDNVAWIGRPPAAVSVSGAAQVDFENCHFEHLASAGLDFSAGTHDDLVQGCVFRDIGGNGIQLGKFSDTNVETHVPYLPPDDREVCAHEKIADNVLTDCANEDWGCVGIAVGYARAVSIEHNEIFNLPYTGISVGWGWTKAATALRDNLIFANRIHDVGQMLGDLGGIYLLSAQPGTVVAGNAISDLAPGPYVPDPQHWFYLYLDEGSSFVTVRDNWCPSEKFLRNANGPGNVWTNNGPAVSAMIRNAAGLEPAFKKLAQQLQ